MGACVNCGNRTTWNVEVDPWRAQSKLCATCRKQSRSYGPRYWNERVAKYQASLRANPDMPLLAVVMVTGGRDNDDPRVHIWLDRWKQKHGISRLVVGDCPTGVDRLAREWAVKNGIPMQVYKADWKTDGRAAGPKRNARMIREGKPTVTLAFPGGRGTADCVTRARMARIRVWEAKLVTSTRSQKDLSTQP